MIWRGTGAKLVGSGGKRRRKSHASVFSEVTELSVPESREGGWPDVPSLPSVSSGIYASISREAAGISTEESVASSNLL